MYVRGEYSAKQLLHTEIGDCLKANVDFLHKVLLFLNKYHEIVGRGYSFMYNNSSSVEARIMQDLRQLGACLNKWVTVTFRDGYNLLVYPTSIGLFTTEGWIQQKDISRLLCRGSVQSPENCINQVVQVELPNRIVISGTLMSVDPNYIFLSIPSANLLAISAQADITC